MVNIVGLCVCWTLSLFELITILGSVFAALFAYIQFKKSQDWKKCEFVLQFKRTELSSFNVRRAMLILDWNIVDVPLEKGEFGEAISFRFKDRDLISALRDHRAFCPGEGFTQSEFIIRKVFDEYFVKLCELNDFVDKGLIKLKHIDADTDYYLRIIFAVKENEITSKDIDCHKAILNYLSVYKFNGLIALGRRKGYLK